jgi:hypothetical protein
VESFKERHIDLWKFQLDSFSGNVSLFKILSRVGDLSDTSKFSQLKIETGFANLYSSNHWISDKTQGSAVERKLLRIFGHKLATFFLNFLFNNLLLWNWFNCFFLN